MAVFLYVKKGYNFYVLNIIFVAWQKIKVKALLM